MIKIRLSRRGAKNSALYRIVAIEKQKKGNGKYLQVLGHYDPKKKNWRIDKELYDKWISVGAQASATVKKLLN